MEDKFANSTTSLVKKITTSDPDFEDFTTIMGNAYPINRLYTEEARQHFKQRFLKMEETEPGVNTYALYREGQMLGGMRLLDFKLQMLSVKVKAGGVGMVGVELQHKKEHVAKDLISFFLRHYREQGTPMALLYPFRPDFYKKMGFGFGTKINHFRVKPESLPAGGDRHAVRWLQKEDSEALLACYSRFQECTNGLIDKKAYEVDRLFTNPETKVIGYFENSGDKSERAELKAYLVFNFKQPDPQNNFMLTHFQVKELVYLSHPAFLGLLAFLNSQADQISEISFYTQEEDFYFLLSDPRNGSGNMIPPLYHESNLQGVGLMYRVIDTAGIFRALQDHNFSGKTCRVKFTIEDNFLPENNKSVAVEFQNGRPSVMETGEVDCEVRSGIADFSSMVMGVIKFKTLHKYGLASISEAAYLETVDGLFGGVEKPICFTTF